ncbi:hypothetical protein BWI17_09070 [Betaproteobacteria bacterium GR16-43]|nr:hypothetical protein BWI17_09070 [Betaproteobacteria bacterium GR16-43]
MKPGSPAVANAATRQPMLAERAARLHVQVERGVLPVRAQRLLPEALREFDAGVKALLAAAPSAEIRENYRLLELLWADYRPHVARTPDPEGPDKLAERGEEVVWIASKGVKLLKDHADDPRSERVRTVGEARLQSQRIARGYFFRQWAARSERREAELRAAGAAYRKAMDALLASAVVGSEAMADLQLAENQYGFLLSAAQGLERQRDPRPGLEAVAKSCDNMLEVLDRVARRYESEP